MYNCIKVSIVASSVGRPRSASSNLLSPNRLALKASFAEYITTELTTAEESEYRSTLPRLAF